VEGESYCEAGNDDTFYRHLLKKNEVPLGQADTIKYWESRFDPQNSTPEDERPWVREVSGRIESLGPNIAGFANDEAAKLNAGKPKPYAAFRGVYRATVTSIRAIPAGKFNVWSEPTDSDAAHANVVLSSAEYIDETGKVRQSVIIELTGTLDFVPPENL
jgi:hypothetical protein